ncbi:response regulator transcription factor [Adlercreutzia sp. R25]|uniref:Response regulator transcription factor n=1 Tax=Adlercreutzia shanghongiae TaxID=3111773 RepID=A0ABU6IWM7_9ACTN|nr:MULTISPECIES: response regulator transcription factor [unclassified Adlercreutzia]MEC4272322.1 response regulator transcription factor [Adlercreutzia sp. R25]MEC4294188.1 response regulator transcription factor [Adlercreutzia sp. R22]
MTKVMLIDDDESMQVLIEQIALRGNYDYCCAGNGKDGLEMLRAERPDFLILDVMLPDTNGFEICETLRAEGRRIPIMFLTAKGDIVDKSIGFKAGADDYLVKPFQPEELLLRLNAHLRSRKRYSGHEGAERGAHPEVFRVGDLEIHPGKYDVRLRGESVALSSREIELLEVLASDAGGVFTRDQILEALWGSKDAADPNSITVMVRKIREKIEDDPSKPCYLITVWRIGYKLADRI